MTTNNVALRTSLRQKSQLMSASEVDRTIVRLAYQIVEENGTQDLGLIGIRRRGVPLAERLSHSIGHIGGQMDGLQFRWARWILLFIAMTFPPLDRSR